MIDLQGIKEICELELALGEREHRSKAFQRLVTPEIVLVLLEFRDVAELAFFYLEGETPEAIETEIALARVLAKVGGADDE